MAPLVLIVDDDERNVRLARDVLERDGLRTLSAATAGEAVALAAERLPDLILLDLRLPDFDGDEALRRLARDERTAGIPVVAWSSQPALDVEAWAFDCGFAAYLEKPIDVTALSGQLRALIGG